MATQSVYVDAKRGVSAEDSCDDIYLVMFRGRTVLRTPSMETDPSRPANRKNATAEPALAILSRWRPDKTGLKRANSPKAHKMNSRQPQFGRVSHEEIVPQCVVAVLPARPPSQMKATATNAKSAISKSAVQ